MEKFLTEVIVINVIEAWWDSSKSKKDDEDKEHPSSSNKRPKASKKKTRNGLSERAEEFCKELIISKEECQKCVCERLCLKCGQKGHYIGDCKGNSSSDSEKRQPEFNLLEQDSANSDNQVLTVLHSDKETQVTRMYGKKVVDSANNGTETTEEPTKLLSVSMPLAMFKQTITQCGLSVSKFV